VRGDGTIRLNQDPIELNDLLNRLTAVFKNTANGVVFVRGENGIEFRQVAEVIDVAHTAGIRRIGLMTR
jgi:biopolymer transport protein TolR